MIRLSGRVNRKQLARIFPLGPDSLRQPGVPRGRLEQFRFEQSRIYPGTVRDYWIYIPAQYRPTQAACLLVVQDGRDHLFRERWDLTVVLDNLIHRRAMPVTIGVFVNPGQVPARGPGDAPRDNRSFEYDSRDDRYARFLIEEILPEAERRYRLRPDGNSRAIMGGSSGAFCAFNAAWVRPDRFARVVSMVGSFTPMRGGQTMAARVRLTAPKPLRVFLEGGAQDLEVACGHWWSANLEMLGALHYAGYEVAHAWDERAGHNEFHTSMVCPQALRWLWRGYPRTVKAGAGSRQPIAQVLSPQRTWHADTMGDSRATALTTDHAGRVVMADAATGTVCRRDSSGRTAVLLRDVPGVAALAYDRAGTLFVTQPAARRVWAIRGRGKARVCLDGVAAHGVCADGLGGILVADPRRGCIWRLASTGTRSVAARGFAGVRDLALSADGSQLLATPAEGGFVWLWSITAAGSLVNAEPYFRLMDEEGPAARVVTGLAVTRPGWVCIATRAGLQLNNQNGLVAGLVAAPGDGPIEGVTLAGLRRDVLCVSSGGRIFRRRIRLLPHLWG